MYEFKTIFKRKHRIVCLFLSCFLCFGTVSTEYLEVQAFEWVGENVLFSQAIPWLLGLLGIQIATDIADVDLDAWRDDYEEHCLNGDYDLTSEDVDNWISEVTKGRLNSKSECWEAFKSWAVSLVAPSSDVVFQGNLESIVSAIPSNIEWSYIPPANPSDIVDSKFGYYSMIKSSDGTLTFEHFVIYGNLDTVSFVNENGYLKFYYTQSGTGRAYFSSTYNTIKLNPSVSGGNSILNRSNNVIYYAYGIPDSVVLPDNVKVWDISTSALLNVYSKELINDIQIALQDAISTAIPGVIPLPWDQVMEGVGDLTDAYEKLQEQVQAGVLDLAKFWEIVQEKLKVLAIDTAGVLVPERPDPDTGEPEKLEDKAQENKDRMGFTLFGLEKVFPFCIPFDIYAFITLLVAEPVAPVIRWPVYNPVTHDNEIITIDFSTWQSVVTLFRYIFDFLFILGMLLMARALIGGGDSA